jgi:ABC-type antimicrobial peptide transport system permease subunit
MIGTGMLLGAAGALALSRVMASFVYGIETTDAIAFAAAPLLFVIAALPAILIPADRAARLDPLAALRHE